MGQIDDGYDADFIEFFWTDWPKKVGKFNAHKEWRKRKLTMPKMIAIQKHIQQRKKDDVRWLPNEKGKTFIPDPERFLKNHREEDDYERRTAVMKEKRYYDVEPEVPVMAHVADPEKARLHLQSVAAMLHRKPH